MNRLFIRTAILIASVLVAFLFVTNTNAQESTPQQTYTTSLSIIVMGNAPNPTPEPQLTEPLTVTLYLELDQIAWYGTHNFYYDDYENIYENCAYTQEVCHAMNNLVNIGYAMQTWPEVYDGAAQQENPYTIYLSNVYDGDGDYLNDWITHLPEQHRGEIASNMQVVVEYAESLGGYCWWEWEGCGTNTDTKIRDVIAAQ